MGAKASRWLATLDLTKHVDEATVELIWEEYDQNHTGYLEGDEVDRLLKHWCAIHKISNFEQVKLEFYERFDASKDGRIARVNLLGAQDKDSVERDKMSGEREDHKIEELKKPRGSIPNMSLRKKSNEEKNAALEREQIINNAVNNSNPLSSSSSSPAPRGSLINSSHPPIPLCTTAATSAPRGSLFGLRNSNGIDGTIVSHEPRGSLFGLRNNNNNNLEQANMDNVHEKLPRNSLFGLRTSSGETQVTPAEHRGSLFDLNKSRGATLGLESGGVVLSSPSFRGLPASPTLTSDQKLNSHNSGSSSGNPNNNSSTNNNAVVHVNPSHIPELNLRGPRASLPATAGAPRRVAKTRRSLPNPTLAKVFSFLHDSTSNNNNSSHTPQHATTPRPDTSQTPNNASNKPPVTPQHTRGTSPFRVFDLLSSRQPAPPITPSTHKNIFPALLITGPTKPLPLAAQAPVGNVGAPKEEKMDQEPLSASFPSYLNPGDCIDKDLLRGVLSVPVPEFVLELELGRLQAHGVMTLADAHKLTLQVLEGIVRPGLARGLHEFLHEVRTSLSSPTLTPYRNSPNHSRSSQFREKLQGRTSVSWGSLSRSDRESNNNPLDLLEPPARFRPAKKFVFNAPLAGDDLLLNYPPRNENSEKRFSL